MAVLTLDEQRKIDGVIQDVTLRTGLSYPSNNLLDIAESQGIEVTEADLTSIGSRVSGLIDYADPTKKTHPRIYISSAMTKERKLFTLAHELGHHFLHKGKKYRIEDLDYSRNDKDTKEESEANYFAASLLVPKDIFLKKISQNLSIEQLAAYFGVSKPVIENRIKWLKNN